MKSLLLMAPLLVFAACGKKAQETNSQSMSLTHNEKAELTNDQLLASAVEGNDPRSTEALLRKGAHPDQLLSDGSTLLTYSVDNNYASVTEALLVGGADTERIDKNGEHPLLLAIKNKNPILARLLVVHGANLDKLDSRLRSPLMLAIMNQDEELAEWLMDRGADLENKDQRGRSAIAFAEEYGLNNLATKIHIRQELGKGVTSDTLLISMMKENDVRGIRELLSRNSAVIHELTNPGALSLAVAMSDETKALEISQLLLDYEVSVQGTLNESKTPLMISAGLGRDKIAKLLLTRGADVKRTDESGKSALVHAVLNYRPDMVSTLLDANAPKNYETQGETAVLKHDVCDYARQAREKAPDKTKKDLNEKSMQRLGCGLRWLIFW